MRRFVLFAVLLFTAAAAAQPPARPPFELEEATIADLQQRMQSGRATARSLAEQYLAWIEAIDRNGPTLRSVLELNPEAMTPEPMPGYVWLDAPGKVLHVDERMLEFRDSEPSTT